jgi:microsomal dipeptidase-like Zn-dependent dipeptidase
VCVSMRVAMLHLTAVGRGGAAPPVQAQHLPHAQRRGGEAGLSAWGGARHRAVAQGQCANSHRECVCRCESTCVCRQVHPSAQFGAIVRTIVEAIALAGPQAVSIGSDFDGGVSVPAGLDAAGMAHLSAGLLQAGVPPRTVSQVLGGNALRVLEASLPDEAAAELR